MSVAHACHEKELVERSCLAADLPGASPLSQLERAFGGLRDSSRPHDAGTRVTPAAGSTGTEGASSGARRRLKRRAQSVEHRFKPAARAAFAEKVGWSRSRLSEFIYGKRGVTADAAIDLAETLGTSSKLWMNLQATYDLDRAMTRRRMVA